MDKVDRNSGILSLLHPIFCEGKQGISRVLGYSKLNKLEKSSIFRECGVEKQKGILEVIHKKENPGGGNSKKETGK